MDKMREEFEKDYGFEYLKKDEEGNYLYWHSKIAWEYFQKGWKASLAALVVELPTEHEQAYGAYDGVEPRHALQQVGIKYE